MAEMKSSGSPAPMEGHGAYNRNSRVQATGLAAALPLLVEAASNVDLAEAPAPIVIADYGASEGHNSLEPMARAIAALRIRIGASRAISVIHTDLPESDFSGLFQTLEDDPDSYLRNDPSVFASAIGRSFYEQILPSESVTLGWSSWAVQWLSRTPAPIPDQVHVACSHDAGARAAYARQADDDWRVFLCHRAGELRTGGRLVVLTMALTDDGDFGYRAVLAAIHGALMDLVRSGDVSAGEAARMAIPTVGRSRADLLAPFAGAGHFAGLTVEHVEIFLADDRIWAQFESDRDAQSFGARWAAFSRASVFPTLALGLEQAKEPSRVSAFLAAMEARMTARLAEAPEPCVIPLARIALAKNPA